MKVKNLRGFLCPVQNIRFFQIYDNLYKLRKAGQRNVRRTLSASLCICLMLFVNFAVQSQNKAENFNALKIGDKVPDSFWQKKSNIYQDGRIITQKLKKYKGKVLILDFWATWCGSCIKGFSHVSSLSESFKGKLSFLLINTSLRDADSTKVAVFLKEYSTQHQDFSIPVLVQNKTYDVLFPSRALPHYVWIGADQRVKAITGPQELTKENVERLISGQLLNLKLNDQ